MIIIYIPSPIFVIVSFMFHTVLLTVKLHKTFKKPSGKEGRNDQPIYLLRKLKPRVGCESIAQSHTTGKQDKGGGAV